MSIQLNFKCNESWEQMPNSQTGKFCNKCTRNIYDLTNKSEEEIQQLYIQNKGKLCGRIKNIQLSPPVINHQKKYALAQFCLALFLTFGSMLFTSEAVAQDKLGKIAVNHPIEFYTIKGQVMDRKVHEPIFGVNVQFDQDGQALGTTTDFEGRYELKINKNDLKSDSLSLQFTSLGYEKLKITNIKLDHGVINLDVVLKEDFTNLEMEVGIIMIDVPLIDPDPDAHRSTIIDADEIKHSPYR